MITEFVYQSYSGSIRSKVENYWIASVWDGKLIFDSWDTAIVGKFKKSDVLQFWKKYL